MINNLSFEGGNDNINYRLSFGNTKIDGYTPGNTLNRNNINLRTIAKITPKLEMDVKVNYIGQNGANRPQVSDASGFFVNFGESLPLTRDHHSLSE